MTYPDAFTQGIAACKSLGRTIQVLHAPQYTDESDAWAYEWAEQNAHLMLMPLARVVVTLRPAGSRGVEVLTALAPTPRA